ncbi:dienelactone hydrolase family protein [Myriangium duriaei CBS 260.36]|uniref:Dienelactone hydrolase family protein n=1 Tax=Myriangium duriaei CBS 260.36 TaxID=1168546 RepID=A0A9P4IX90_9PEZI|nr:dienelactone hydrolase family protein [Myriangium duriaei CBS 260.36]
MQACCAKGFNWDGTPKGHEDKIAGHDTYITGDNKDRAIFFVHDGAGWKQNNARLLADHFADEVGATVYIPDFFKDQPFPYPPEAENGDNFDLQKWIGANMHIVGAWMAKNSKDIRGPDIFAVAETLRKQYSRVGATGYCYGGWACFQLGGKGKNLVDAISVAHPSALTKEEIENVGVPVQIHAPEHDPVFNPELKKHALDTLPHSGNVFSYQLYPGQEHGFATRGDQRKSKERQAMTLAKDLTVAWFRNWLVLN